MKILKNVNNKLFRFDFFLEHWAAVLLSFFIEWCLFIIISRESKWGTLKSAGNPRCAVPAEIHSICTDQCDSGPAAGLQVSPPQIPVSQSPF